MTSDVLSVAVMIFLVQIVSGNGKEDTETHKVGKSKHSKEEKKETEKHQEKDYEKQEHGKKGIRK